MNKKRVLSCIQPTGEMHIGNYFGAVKNWARIQDAASYDCVYGIVDLHAMTMPYEPEVLRANTLRMAVDLLACGIDPSASVLFIQSLVPEHTELTWIFNCVASYGELMRMTQFKDKSEQLESGSKGYFVSAGLFTYPVLQAADILIYRAELVPVGKDQEQHLELSRNIAVRFNHQFGSFFPEPQPLFTEIPKLMSLADPTKKMSKSLGEKHYVGLFEDEAGVRRKVRAAVTDTGESQREGEMSPGVENLFSILKSCDKAETVERLMADFTAGTLKYADLKDATGDALVELTSRLRARREELGADEGRIKEMIYDMSAKARKIAARTLAEVRSLTGLTERPS
jgi:tryptophanyl-tRNA synthetase